MGRAAARRLFSEGRVLVIEPSGRRHRGRKGELAAAGSVLEVQMAEADLDGRAMADDDLELVLAFETSQLVVVDKAAGVPSAPLRPGEKGTVANALLARYPEMASIGFSPREPGICHRLDTGTSGLLLAARSAAAFDALTQALAAGELRKRYLVVCRGADLSEEGSIELPLATQPGDRRRVVACAEPSEASRLGARPARTRYRLIRRGQEGRALVEAIAPRAHRHQIRAHFAAIGAPLVGDQLYDGEGIAGLERHALHASYLGCSSARDIAPFEVSSPLPADLDALL